MTDQPNDTTILIVTLNTSELDQAARLGGLASVFEEGDLDAPELSNELVRFFAERGIRTAIQRSFDQEYPSHYPEDFDDHEVSDAVPLRPCELKRRKLL